MSLLGIQLFPSRNSSPPEPPDDRTEMDVLEAFRRGFQWIKDENLLRDEGVISGIAQARPENKVRLIENYIEFEKASREVEIEELEKLLTEKKQQLAQLRDPVEQTQEETGKDIKKTAAPADHHVVGALIKLGVITLTLAACYHLLYWWLYDVTYLPELIALGVLFFGTFSIFLPRPYLFDLEGFYEAMPLFKRWRVYFETFVPPLAATIFAIAWGQTESVNGWQLIALSLFLFVLFLVTGRLFLHHLKLALSEVRKAQAATGIRLREWRKQRRIRKRDQQIHRSAESIEAEIRALRERLLKVKQERESLHRLAPTLVDYFQTEYDIASSYTRHHAPDRSLNDSAS